MQVEGLPTRAHVQVEGLPTRAHVQVEGLPTRAHVQVEGLPTKGARAPMVYQLLSLSHTTRRSYDGALYGLKYVGCAPSNVELCGYLGVRAPMAYQHAPSRHASNVVHMRPAYLPVWPCHMVGSVREMLGHARKCLINNVLSAYQRASLIMLR